MVQTGGCAITPSTAAAIYPACGNLIKNGSFENPVMTTNGWLLLSVPNWTNLVDNNKIEVHRNYLGSPSEGSQYIELNGNAAGTIYQDVQVIAGKTLHWKLDHRANTTRNEYISVTLSAPDGTNSQSFSHKGLASVWQSVSGTYTAAPGQTSVRMKIASTVSSNAYMGNFLDNVSLEYEGCGTMTTMSASAMLPAVNTGSELATLNVLPNPVTSNAEISLKGFDNGEVNLMVTDATGKVLKNLKYDYNPATPYIMDLTSLKPGFYLIKVEQAGKSATAKMLKN